MLVGKWRSTTLVLFISVAAVSMWGLWAPAADAEGFKFKEAFGPDGTNAAEFASVGPVAVDEAEGSAYVLDRSANALYKFDLEGSPLSFGGLSPNLSGNELSGLSIGGEPGGRQVAVDPTTHTIYLTGVEEFGAATAIQAFKANGEPSVFPATGTNKIGGFPSVRGVSVDSVGNIYIAGTEPGNPPTANNISIYSRSGAILVPSVRTDLVGIGNIAVDSTGVIYAISSFSALVRLVPSSFPVEPDTTYEEEGMESQSAVSVTVDPLTKQVYLVENAQRWGQGVSRVSVFAEDGKRLRVFAGPGEEGELFNPDGVAIANVDVPEIVGKVAKPFVANNPLGGPNQVEIFEEELIIDKPSIEATFPTDVTADSAVLVAKINSNNRSTTYRFEIGAQTCEFESTCKDIPLAPVSIGQGRKGVIVSQPVTGLAAGSIFKFRVVAVNDKGTAPGIEKTFTTQSTGLGFTLSDSRVWEMVSPTVKFNGRIVPDPRAIVQAQPNGDGLVYGSLGSVIAEPQSSHPPQIASVLAGREPDGLWTARDLSVPHTERALIGSEFKIFTPDLLRAAMEPTDSTPLSPQASEKTAYLWDDGNPPTFTPLVNPENVLPPGAKFGPQESAPDPVKIEGVSPNLDHVVIKSNNPLVENAAKDSLYLWSGGELKVVSEFPDSEEGGIIAGGSMLGSGRGSVRHAISNDGARVFWTSAITYDENGINLPSLYVRDTVAGESGRLDVPRGGSGEGAVNPAFNAANADGGVVFFTDSQHLTADASSEGRDLYRCEIGEVEGGLGCTGLTDISAPPSGSGENTEAQDQAPAVTDDGSRLYFVARGVLDQAPNKEGETAAAREPNLYYWQEDEGTRFIATLSERDSLVWGKSPNTHQGYGVDISAAASASGRFFAFTSERSLTGLENLNENDELTSEAFLYDADEGDLTCVSCNPTGAAPVGERLSGQIYFPPDPLQRWAGRWVAATLPQASENDTSGRSFYHPRTVLDNGRVFFNSVDPLVPADSNGNWDVYQFQPVGVGSCTASTNATAVVRLGGGCVGLVSAGTSEGDAGFLETTPSGDDVFFMTAGRLSVLDRDEELDVYDARVNGIKQVLNPVQDCAGEACQAAVGPPNDPTPASESFRGPEPTLRCRKGQQKVHKKGKAVCVRKKHKKHGKHHKKQAGKNGRAGR